MHSCLYEGRVRHRRFAPKSLTFNYRVFYVLLDLDELDSVFSKRWFWSTTRPAFARFRRADYLAPHELPLKQAVAKVVKDHTGHTPRGPIRLLTHLRYFGYVFNPVSFYYCFDPTGTQVDTIVAEVTNTPWGERHVYVLPQSEDNAPARHARFKLDKEFHVSPFMPMDMHYDWRFSLPEQRLSVHMENYTADDKLFDATLALEKKALDGLNCAYALLRYPFMTLKVAAAIYWQALKLLFKGVPVYTHPDKLDDSRRNADTAKSL